MSIYPGEKPHYGTITERQYQQLKVIPTLVAALAALIAAQSVVKDVANGNAVIGAKSTAFLIGKTLDKLNELGVETGLPAKLDHTGLMSARGEECADRAQCTVDYYAESFGTDDSSGGIITDLVADIMFLCEREGIDFEGVVEAATIHYESER